LAPSARVIYFYHDAGRPLYLLMVYAKARRSESWSQRTFIRRPYVQGRFWGKPDINRQAKPAVSVANDPLPTSLL
jgi:hypothetical protein